MPARLLLLLMLLAGPALADSTVPPPVKTLRYAFSIAESGFDPAQFGDLYSRTVAANIFEAPLAYEFMARPVRLRLATAAAMPEISPDRRHFTFRLRPGIFFADDPAFGGRPRELVAADYVYAIKRHYDPRWKSPHLQEFEKAGILGLGELRRRLIAAGLPFDYEQPVAGLRALDRYRFEIRLARPQPRFVHQFTDASMLGAVAREVVEAYGDQIGAHPVGTGPFRLTQWTRNARIVLERNPGYRETYYDEHPPADDARLQAAAAALRGRRLPMLDRIEIAIIEEAQPRWLSFLNAEQDLLEKLPDEFAALAIPHDRLAPHLARRRLQMERYTRPSVSISYFAMEHPVVGGYRPPQVALRRAIALAVDVDSEIRLVRRGQALPAQSPIAPQVYGYEPGFKSEMSEFNLARAKALLDMHGYVDRDGDGWRDLPDGRPLRLEYATQPDQQSRQLIEQWRRNMDALGVRIEFRTALWSENLKRSRAGTLMMWGMGWLAGQPDADTFLALGYGGGKGQSNPSRFDLPAFNALYERQAALPDGPERLALLSQAKKLLIAYMPMKVHAHHVSTDLAQPWLLGYHRNVYTLDFWRYLDIDTDLAQSKMSFSHDFLR